MHKRVIATSVAIICVFSILLGGVVNTLYKKSYFAVYASELLTMVPRFVAELRQEITLDQFLRPPLSTGENAKDYIALICNQKNEITWLSKSAKQESFADICKSLPKTLSKPTLSYFQEEPYILYNISEHLGFQDNHFFIIRHISNEIEQFAEVKNSTWFYVFLLFSATILMIYAASYWSFSPLRKLTDELNDITSSKRETLSGNYPSELEDVTEALNRMIHLREKQTQRYRHAMDDLAHSLKSRLAATNAILDDSNLSREMLAKRIIQQVIQMDDVVQYQLKRAMVGQQGLIKDNTPIMPILKSLIGMFTKIYSDKPVQIYLDISASQTLPLNKADLTELLGNLLENAFRFCIMKIRVRCYLAENKNILLIEDDGPGVPIAFRESIFQRGIRADQLTPGTGIGLAVCSEIVESYSGNIRIISSHLEGAGFIMSFQRNR